MSRMKKAAVAVAAAAAVGVGFAMWGAGTASGQTSGTVAKLTASEQAGLVFSRDEERMARELYTLFADKYDVGPFAMISSSEQRHFDAVGVLLTKYAVSDPAAGAKTGVYGDATLQKQYDGWKASGLESVTAAYQVGVSLEKRDIADLDRLQADTSNTDLDWLYSRLQNGSEHHLAAFTAAANGSTVPRTGTGAQRHGRHAGMGAMAGTGTGGPGYGQGRGPGLGQGRGPGARGQGCPIA